MLVACKFFYILLVRRALGGVVKAKEELRCKPAKPIRLTSNEPTRGQCTLDCNGRMDGRPQMAETDARGRRTDAAAVMELTRRSSDVPSSLPKQLIRAAASSYTEDHLAARRPTAYSLYL